MSRTVVATNEVEERAKGRVALWLDPADLEYIAGHCCCADGAPQDQVDRCARIRFRANAALHKSGHKPDAPV